MKKQLIISTGIILFFLLISTANSATYITHGATYQYTFTNPGSGWEQPGFDDSQWNMGLAPFGNQSRGDFAYKTYWAADGSDGFDVWLRITVELPAMSQLQYDLGVDNGFELWLNGTSTAAGNAGGYTTRWEYSGLIDTSSLYSGTNYIAIALEDHGGNTAFDMQLTGNPVPTPGAVWLLGSSIAGLAGIRLRRKKK